MAGYSQKWNSDLGASKLHQTSACTYVKTHGLLVYKGCRNQELRAVDEPGYLSLFFGPHVRDPLILFQEMPRLAATPFARWMKSWLAAESSGDAEMGR